MSQENQGGAERINKAMAAAGFCSRRTADEWIKSGLVRVNGKLVTECGVKVAPGDEIEANGKKVRLSGKASKHFYIMLNKPVQVVSTVHDPEGRTTVLDILPEALKKERLYPVGRLDYFSEGLLLLTNDGALTERLTHPRYHLPKIYEVLVREEPSSAVLGRMRAGMTLAEGEKLAPVEVKLERAERGYSLTMTLHQGINRQIRRMCRDVGLTILRLKRLEQGPLALGELGSGKCRELTEGEVVLLRKACNLK